MATPTKGSREKAIKMNVRDLSGDAREQAEESLSDVLASWWEAVSGEETYAHEWAEAADAVLRIGYRR